VLNSICKIRLQEQKVVGQISVASYYTETVRPSCYKLKAAILQ